MELGDIPQAREYLEFAKEGIKNGTATGIYQEVSLEHARRALAARDVISSAFVVWKEKDFERSRWFVVELSVHSNHWAKGSERMETPAHFSMRLQPEDDMLSFDIEKGSCYLRLHPAMRDWFIFRYDEKNYQ